MFEIAIPERFKPGFQKLASLPDDIFDRLLSELKTCPSSLSPKALEFFLLSKIKHDGLPEVVSTLVSLGNLYYSWEEDNKTRLADQLASAYIEDIEDRADIDKLRERLKLVFSNFSALSSTFKAVTLLNEVNAVYRKSKIITDIRLVFGDEIATQPRVGVIFHQLKVEYTSQGDNQEFFTHMDKSDLLDLKSQIERALEKEAVIRKDYANAISFIDYSEQA